MSELNMDFGSLLAQFSTADNEKRQYAENQLANAMNTDFSKFVMSMIEVLVDKDKPTSVRQMAGILFKRAISSLSGPILKEKQIAWNNLDADLRSKVKAAMISCLNDDSCPIRNAAASAMSAIARIEIPIGLWNSLFDDLNCVVQDPSVRLETKSACIEAIRFICEDLDPDSINDTMSASILLMLLYCLQGSMPTALRDEAIQALNVALDYAYSFMQTPEQCTRVMEAVYSCCQDASLEVQTHAIICLNAVFELYYDLLSPFFAPFYTICKEAITSVSDVAIQACFSLETLAVVEKMRLENNEPCFNLAASCGADLVEVLCIAMTKQREEDDGETMTVPMAAATCLAAFCEVLKNDVVSIVWPFVSTNINSTNWHLQEASLMIFGCLLHGPDPSLISGLVAEACSILLPLIMSGSCIAVRDSAAWAMSQICESHLASVPGSQTQQVLQVLIDALDMEPRVSQHAALAISYICDYIAQPDQESNLISSYYQSLLQKLLNCSEKVGVANNQLRENAAYALMSLIGCCAMDCEELLESFLQFVIEKCKICLNSTDGDQEDRYHLQRFYCIVLVSLVQRLGLRVTNYVDMLAEISYKILCGDNTSAHTQGILLFSGLVASVPSQSLKFISHLLPFIVNAINTPNDVHTCRSAITCLGNILHTVGSIDELTFDEKIQIFNPILALRDDLIKSLVESLQNGDVERDIKPDLFICLSDIFWELSDYCLYHVETVMKLSLDAANYPVDTIIDEEGMEWLDRLFCSVVDLWDALSECAQKCQGIMENSLQPILIFISHVVVWNAASTQLIKACVLMLRDLGIALGYTAATMILNTPCFDSLLVRALSGGDECTAAATECRDTLQRVMRHEYISW